MKPPFFRLFSSVQGAFLRRRELPTTRFVLPSSSGVTISPLSSNPSPFPFSTVTRRVAPHSPTFIRGSLSSSQERQPSVRSPQPALLKSRPARVSSQGWQKNRKLFAQTRGLSFSSAQLFPRIVPLIPALYYFFCWIARLLLRFLVSLSLPSPTRQAPSPIVHPQPPLLYVYLPSICCPRRPLRHESGYRRRTPRRMGSISRGRRTTPDHRQRIAHCAN